MAFVLLRTSIATGMAFFGGIAGSLLGRVASHHLRLMVYAAMGVLLAVTLCDVLPDAKHDLSWPLFLFSVVSGFLLFWVLGKYVAPLCPSCAYSAFDDGLTRRWGQTVVLLMLALGLHSTMDGMAVVVGDRITGHANIGVLFGISIHKIPEGLALVLILIGAGYARRTALLWTFAIEATTELGGLLGLLALRHVSPLVLNLVFGHIGGGFLYLVVSTLSSFRGNHPGEPQANFMPLSLVIGSSVAFTLTALLLWGLSR